MKTKPKSTKPARRVAPTHTLPIELPELSNAAAAAVAEILVQLYHRFEAAYYGQILNHHADRMVAGVMGDTKTEDPEPIAQKALF